MRRNIFSKIPDTMDTTENYESLYKKHNRGLIDLDISIQRGEVWDIDTQKSFVKSFYNGAVKATIIFNAVENDEGKIVWRCIDGKQRLTTLLKFRKNELSATLERKEVSFSELSDEQREKFCVTRKLIVSVFQNASKEVESLIFRLNQNGKPLTRDEKTNGSGCPLVQTCNKIMKHLPVGIFGSERMKYLTPIFRTIELCVKVTKEGTNIGDLNFCDVNDCHEWAIAARITPDQEKRLKKVAKRLTKFLEREKPIKEKKTITLILLMHALYVEEDNLYHLENEDRTNRIREFRKLVEEILPSNKSGYTKNVLEAHIATIEEL
ncbi:putative nuclease [Brazilian marseillevirus]|uniref:putative nuclease n=1 Tax=Brazilian marseillevirus TaxID=1813599 RepID=UPI000782EFC0|nr:putative nuclease [Brazilian marseillevirus]AMQ10651.1 putative nuclease [Brazilian marseillevirus]